MKKNSVNVVFDRKYRVKGDGIGTVDVVVNLSRTERKYISVGKCKRSEVDELAQSSKVRAIVKKCEKVIAALSVLGLDTTVANFNEYYNNEEDSASRTTKNVYKGVDQGQSFIDYMQKQIDSETLADGTRRHKLVILESLKTYKKIKTFADLTARNIFDYDQWLHNGQRSDVTIKGYHKKIHKYVLQLWKCDMIPSDPYNQVTIKSGKCKERDPLLEEQMVLIRKAYMPKLMLEHARDLFVFSCYTGLAYCDVMAFDFKTMTIKCGDLYYIDGRRIKTKGMFFTPILPPAMAILRKYDYKLPHMSNEKENESLKVIRLQLGIRQNLTFHVARHSFATLALAHGISIENVAKMLGHKNIKTTQIYAKVLRKTLTDNSDMLAKEIM